MTPLRSYRILYMVGPDPDAATVDREAAEQLIAQFDRMVSRDGGSLTLESLRDGTLRVVHWSGSDLSCEGDSCVLRSVELEQMMAEVLERRGSRLRVEVRSQPVNSATGDTK
jgi:hypothetical protein